MSLASLFTWGGSSNTNVVEGALPDIFPIEIKRDLFIDTDITNIYCKILTDVVERTSGLDDKQAALLWDNCLKSSSNEGLITLLSKAMSKVSDLFLVYESGPNVLRIATVTEQGLIKADYEKAALSKVGIYVSFKNYNRSHMIKFYSGLEYSTVGALSKMMNLSKAIQLKMNDMRSAVSVTDSSDVVAQAISIATALSEGKDTLLDGKDEIVTSVPDLTAVKESISFLDAKRSFYLGLPSSYITGEQTGGLNATGETDTRAVERGLRNYYFAIIKPVIEALFDVQLTYKTQDFRQIGQALEALKTFELVSEDLLNLENKKRIIENLLDIDADDNETTPAPPAVMPPPREVGQRSLPNAQPVGAET